MPKYTDLTGHKFSILTVLERDCLYPRGQRVYWICRCECGNYTLASTSDLKSGHTKSCGCHRIDVLKKRSITHGLSNGRICAIWRKMKDRCYNPNNNRYSNYGAKGIKVCDEWLNDLRSFYDWAMANGYRDDLSIDRIDVNGNYEPSNCRWATAREQANNTSRNCKIAAFGQTKTLTEWARETGINRNTLKQRLDRGLSAEEALTIKNALAEAGTF